MSNIKTILGRDIDLTEIQRAHPENKVQEYLPKGVEYISIRWRKIPKYSDDNLGIRADGTPNAYDTLGHDLETNGWDINANLPVEDADTGDLNDGRTRENEARRLGVEYMPVIIAKIPPHLKRASGIISNKHPYSKRATMADCVVGLVSDIEDGYIEPNHMAIETALHKNYKVRELFADGGGTYTKIVKQTLDRVENSSQVIRNKEGEGWKDWVNTKTEYSGTLVLSAGGKAYQRFTTDHYIPKGAKGEIIDIILYANEYTVERCKEVLKAFVKNTNKLHNNIFKMVNKKVSGITITIPKPHYNIVGVCPNVQNDIQKKAYENGELISYDDYIK